MTPVSTDLPAAPPASERGFITEKPKKRLSGEPLVWLTSLGLVLGLSMILYLLGVIAVNGLTVFWPKDVVRLELREGGAVMGEIVLKQVKHSRVVEKNASEGANVEWQMFLGNRDAYGLAFRYVDGKNIARWDKPGDAAVFERLEYGDAIAYPIKIAFAEGNALDASEPSFAGQLENEIREAKKRWKQIRGIEKGRIGRINARIEKLRLEEKSRTAKNASDPKVSSIRAETAALEKEFQTLASEARKLRDRQRENALHYKLASGEERKVATGSVVDFYYPNRLTQWDKFKRFAHGIWRFVSEEPREANTEGGIFPAIFGTFVMTVIMSAAVTPFGVLAAIYLREYAKQGFFLRAVRIAINNLAGVPSIVFGVFGLGFFVYTMGGTIDQLFYSDKLPTPTFGTGGILWASLTLALMTVPVVIVATEEAIAAVPRGMREGSLACGASKWQTIRRIVLPASAPGIMTGLILAMARGAGEVAPLMIVGVVKLAPSLPLDTLFPFLHFDRKFMHLGFHIYDLGFQSPDSEAAKPMVYATTLVLIALVVVLNLTAFNIRQHLRKKYATGAF